MLSTDMINNQFIVYNEKLDKYFNNTKNNSYIFELEKCCGYSEFILCFVESTLEEFYTNVSYQFQTCPSSSNIRLYIVINNEKILVEKTNMKIKEFIKEFRQILKPVYPLPCKVVYKLFIDDGHCHEDHASLNNQMLNENGMEICRTCIIHNT